eukprot:355041-Chlamydomonas_euryale.AAC.3
MQLCPPPPYKHSNKTPGRPRCLTVAARCSGVQPSCVRVSMSAPRSSSSATISRDPYGLYAA